MKRSFTYIFYSFLFACIFLINCKQDSQTTDNNAITAEKATNNSISIGDYQIFVDQFPNDSSFMRILHKGDKKEIYGYKGTLEIMEQADLNQDGNPEVFFTLNKKEQPRNLVALSLVNGYPNEIYFQEYGKVSTDKDQSYKIINNQLIKKFNVNYSDGSSFIKELRYNLVSGEAGYILKPEGYTSSKIDELMTDFEFVDQKNKGNSRHLSIEKNASGEYVITIDTKKNWNPNCNFSGIGYFYDRNLVVPLSYANPKLKGQLNIKFVNDQAFVYTSNKDNNKELTTFCKRAGSIAGNYMKNE